MDLDAVCRSPCVPLVKMDCRKKKEQFFRIKMLFEVEL